MKQRPLSRRVAEGRGAMKGGLAACVLVGAALAVPSANAAWGYEKVTPAQKGAASVQSVEPFQVAPDGQSILHTATAPYDAVPSASAPVYVPYLSERADNSWDARALAPPMNLQWGAGAYHYLHGIVGTSENLRYALVASSLALAPGAVPGGSNLYRLDARTGGLTWIAGAAASEVDEALFFQAFSSYQNGAQAKYIANDGSAIVFAALHKFQPGGIPGSPDSGRLLFEWTEAGGLEVISRRPASEGGGMTLISRAGNDGVYAVDTRDSRPRTQGASPRYAFTGVSGFASWGPAYLRENGVTRPISVTRLTGSPSTTVDANVHAVSDGGRFILFSTEIGGASRLTDDSPAGSGANLYLYDADADTLKFIGALGMVPGGFSVIQMTHNGRSVAFTSREAQSPGAVAGRNNLYVWRDGALKLVKVPDAGSAADADGGLDALMSDSGRFLAFADDSASLAMEFGFDSESVACAVNGAPAGPCQQVYRFDADAPASDALECVSCRDDGAEPAGASGDPVNRSLAGPGVPGPLFGSTMSYNSHVRQIVAEDGSVFFTSADDLLPADTNGEHDAYAYRDGQLHLLSRAEPGMRSRFVDASRDGKTVLISTNDPITPDDTDRAVDLYVTREGAGFEFPPVVPEPICTGGDCRGPWPGADPPRDPQSRREPGAQVPPRAEPRATVSLSSLRLKGRTLRATVRVSGSGRIRVSGKGLRAGTREVRKAGRYQVTVRLTSTAQRTLKRNGRLAVRARISVSPPFGRSAVKNYRRTVRN